VRGAFSFCPHHAANLLVAAADVIE